MNELTNQSMQAEQALSEENKSQNTMHIKSGNTAVEVIAHFSDERTYEDIIKAALKRELSN